MSDDTGRPTCLGFIMDGNRRWAREQGLPTLEGHRRGFAVFKECVRWARDRGVEHLAFYAFSTENWKRTEDEVGYLMALMQQALEGLIADTPEERARVRVIGQRDDLSPELRERIETVERETIDAPAPTVWVALSYGGRDEIVRAATAAIARGDAIDEAAFAALLDTAELPDPDIIVRTGGERRLSNFLTWRSVYSELYFTDTYWPEMTESDFDAILSWYAGRHRRFGA